MTFHHLGFLLFVFAFLVNAQALQIQVDGDNWGNASTEDIGAVLHSAASEIWKYCPSTHIDKILVHRRYDYPQADHDRDSDGRIVIGLQTGDRYWAQYAYQFAHEFCHALAGHTNDYKEKWRSLETPHLWFEESLCEAASLFALRAMGRSWEICPPNPGWESYARNLTEYAQDRIDDPKHTLPPNETFQKWFKKHENELRHKWMHREKNTIVAKQLLPLFETEPQAWEAVTYINLVPRDPNMAFYDFLCNWKKISRKDFHGFIDKIFILFFKKAPRLEDITSWGSVPRIDAFLEI